MAHVVIIGSGIAGLFAASKLADAGHTVSVATKQRTKAVSYTHLTLPTKA